MPAVVWTPNSANTATAQPTPTKVSELDTPNLLASVLGMIRPGIEPAFRIAS